MTITVYGSIMKLQFTADGKGGDMVLSNLRAELVRKNLVPEQAIREVLGCTDKTARAKLNGDSDFSLPEAIKIMNIYFKDDGFQYEILFQNCDFKRA